MMPNTVIATDETGFPVGPRSQIVLAKSTRTMQTIAVSYGQECRKGDAGRL